jgi:DNA modification methylase
MQYKTVPVTEYVLVYRKHSDKLIDWHIRQQKTANVQASKIGNDYERTNVWRLQPETRSKHPAAFPIGLAERVIKYYSFVGDMVLDPFAGSGTVGKAARSLGRRYYLIDQQKTYCEQMIMEPWAQGMLLNVT